MTRLSALEARIAELERTRNWFKVRKDNDGNWVPTLTQHLGHFLHDLESRFGKRDQSFTILGIEFLDPASYPNPQTFFHLTNPDELKHVAVQLNSYNNPKILLWQLAHECVHLLDPRKGEWNVLEEGLASWYQDLMVQGIGRGDTKEDRRYEEAKTLVVPLMDQYPDVVRNIRAQGVRICDISVEQLRSHCPGITHSDLFRLMSKNHKGNDSP